MRSKNTETKSIRVSVPILKKVISHVKKTKQTIGGFYDLAVEEKLKKENQTK